MHSTRISSSSTSTPSSSITTTSNIEQYHYPPISTLRRPSRPSNIDLSIFDANNSQQSNDPGIYSAPICYLKQTNNHHQHIQQSSHPYTATFHYQPQLQQMQLPSHHHPQQQQHNIHLYQQQQQQQQHILDPFSQHQHTPHTFPLQTSPNHYHQYFHFPPSTLQVNITNNTHQTTNTNQSSTPPPSHNNRLRAVQIQEQRWSNPALSPLMVKRMNESVTSMQIDDDEDPSASIDALVADDDSSPHDLLDDQQNKSVDVSKTSSTTPAGTISPSPHLYLRGTSHILTTPPNPLASDDHPDNQLTVGNNFQKNFSPIPSAGFELTSAANPNIKLSSSNTTRATSFFTFDTNILEQANLKNQHNDDNKEDIRDKITKPLARTTTISTNSLIQDDNSNHSSTNSSGHNTSSRMFSQILQSSEQQQLSSSSPRSTDVKLSPLASGNNNQTNINSSPLQQQQQNRHLCSHPDCLKVFANKSALAKHKLTHSQDRKHKCPKCNKGFKRLDHLHGHMLTHEEEKPHKCRVPNCNRTYCDGRSLKRHIENTHQDILAAIHEGQHDEYKQFLPETACVKTKDLSIHSDFSIDSIDSNSPRSLIDNEQSLIIRTPSTSGNRTLPTYTFDEEKCVECHICKKTFKNGAALNGHMRLHGGFNEKQPSSVSTDNIPKRKRLTTTKRKRADSPSASTSNEPHQGSILIKNEEQDILIPNNNHYQQHQPSILPPSLEVLQHHFYDQTSSTRTRSASSSVIQPPTTLPNYTIKNPMSAQPATKPNRRQVTVPTREFNEPRMIRFDAIGNPQRFPNASTINHYDDKVGKSLPTDHYSHNQPMNGIPSHYSHIQVPTNRHLSNVAQYPITSSSLIQTKSIPQNLLHHLFRQTGETLNKDFYQPPSSFNESIHHIPPPHLSNSPIHNSTSSIINTPVTSPYSNIYVSQCSPSSSSQFCNNTSSITNNGMQSSPATNSTSSSCSSSSSNAAPKKRFLKAAVIQETQDDKQQKIVENTADLLIDDPLSTSVLTIVPDLDSPAKKPVSGFLIGTPSSTGTNSSSSTSSHTHFTYENIVPPEKVEPTPSSFQWPSQFRRQLSLNIAYQTSNPLPSTPYTPPPMLSPFRKGPGLYYRVFSQPGPSETITEIPTTPLLPFTPIGEESSGPKINIGTDYQAIIPKLETKMEENDTGISDELLFSPSELSYLDEKSLEKYEQLSRTNPFLFSPRHSPTLYPLELVYMLLHEYNGDLQRTLAALLDGTAKDIKQCRPLHRYRFPECDQWTKEEIDAFTKAIQNSEKNFELVSRAVGTKNVKQCIEFHYMPKVNTTARKILSTGTNTVMTRRKRFQMMQIRNQLDDETSSSSFNEFRLDEDGTSDSFSATQFSCDIDECSQIFTTERACRAHRKDHRRTNNNMTITKRSRNIDSK